MVEVKPYMTDKAKLKSGKRESPSEDSKHPSSCSSAHNLGSSSSANRRVLDKPSSQEGLAVSKDLDKPFQLKGLTQKEPKGTPNNPIRNCGSCKNGDDGICTEQNHTWTYDEENYAECTDWKPKRRKEPHGERTVRHVQSGDAPRLGGSIPSSSLQISADLEAIKRKWEKANFRDEIGDMLIEESRWNKMFSEIAQLIEQKDKTIAEIGEAFNDMRGEADEWWEQLSERDELIAAKDKEIERLRMIDTEVFETIGNAVKGVREILDEPLYDKIAARQKEINELKQALDDAGAEGCYLPSDKSVSRKRVKGG
jgi:hypothetical protein